MSIVDFDSTTWSDRWFRKLTPKLKILFIYLWTNDHKNVAGLYGIDFDQIAFESGLSIKDVEKGMKLLIPKVLYDEKTGTVLVVNHVRRQFYRTGNISPKIIGAIQKNLIQYKNSSLIQPFLDEYEYLNIEYKNPIDRVYSYPSSGGGGVGGGGGKDRKKENITYPEWLDMELWKEYLKHRTHKDGKKLSEHAEKLNITELKKITDLGYTQEQVVNECIMKGWKGFYEPKNISASGSISSNIKCKDCGGSLNGGHTDFRCRKCHNKYLKGE